MKFNWRLREQNGEPTRLSIPKYLDRILTGRGFLTDAEKESFLDPSLIVLHDPFLLKGMDKTVERLKTAFVNIEKVLILGDYDMDGISATSIYMKTLQTLGFQCQFHIPHRVEEGYGFQKKHVDLAKEIGASVILTCDNGIQSFDAVDVANQEGIDVLITDHHLPKNEGEDILPESYAIVNPHQINCTYPFKELSGAGVSLKIAQALWQELREDKIPPILFGYAALGTLGDIMQLTEENRRLVTIGLLALNTCPTAGLEALIQALKIYGPITEHEVGFQLAPTLNAAGRLDHANIAAKLLLTDNPLKGKEYSEHLIKLNKKRKVMTEKAFDDALDIIQIDESLFRTIVYLKNCHESLLGIVAGRLKDKFQRDAYVFTDAREEGYLKASGRGFGEGSMIEDLKQVDSLLHQFGGHTSAAGLTLSKEHFSDFKKAMEEEIEPMKRGKEDLFIDFPIEIKYISSHLLQEIDAMKPFGEGNPQVVFASKQVQLIGLKVLGKNKSTLQFVFAAGNQRIKGIQFRGIEETLRYLYSTYGIVVEDVFDRQGDGISIDICYHLQVNEFAGKKSLQLQILDVH